ncbi:MAG: FAD-dependent oxidoreductase, partial [Myxococcales bacterium]|nr:FAD-dependent oxidoreductase [Myxococcales bacterium]
MKTSEVVVVGGGAIGASAAFFLAREGIEVTLLERDALAAGASGAAAGMLTPAGEAEAPGPFLTWATRSLQGFEALAAELLERSGVDCE